MAGIGVGRWGLSVDAKTPRGGDNAEKISMNFSAKSPFLGASASKAYITFLRLSSALRIASRLRSAPVVYWAI